jgi:hypothetical protein
MSDAIIKQLDRIEEMLSELLGRKPPPSLGDVVFSDGHRPKFWRDAEVRSFVIHSHRRSTLDEASAEARKLFGPERAPSKSAINRVWLRIDKQTKQRAA